MFSYDYNKVLQSFPMFSHEDLPLFSGTAPTGRTETFEPCETPHKLALGVDCRLCLDTGELQIRRGVFRRCWCKAGQEHAQTKG